MDAREIKAWRSLDGWDEFYEGYKEGSPDVAAELKRIIQLVAAIDPNAAHFLDEALGQHPEFTIQRIIPILAGETGDKESWEERWQQIKAIGIKDIQDYHEVYPYLYVYLLYKLDTLRKGSQGCRTVIHIL